MTTIDVTYRVLALPSEANAIALNSLREVYGIRRALLDERSMQVHVEYDSTRLSEEIVRQLLRRTGLEVGPLATPEPVVSGPTTG